MKIYEFHKRDTDADFLDLESFVTHYGDLLNLSVSEVYRLFHEFWYYQLMLDSEISESVLCTASFRIVTTDE